MYQMKEWVYRYGSNSHKLLEIAYNNYKRHSKDSEKLMIISELIYCVEEESIYNISDFLIRRTSRLYFDKTNINKYLEELLLELSTLLKLNKEQINIQREEFMKKYKNTVDFVK